MTGSVSFRFRLYATFTVRVSDDALCLGLSLREGSVNSRGEGPCWSLPHLAVQCRGAGGFGCEGEWGEWACHPCAFSQGDRQAEVPTSRWRVTEERHGPLHQQKTRQDRPRASVLAGAFLSGDLVPLPHTPSLWPAKGGTGWQQVTGGGGGAWGTWEAGRTPALRSRVFVPSTQITFSCDIYCENLKTRKSLHHSSVNTYLSAQIVFGIPAWMRCPRLFAHLTISRPSVCPCISVSLPRASESTSQVSEP